MPSGLSCDKLVIILDFAGNLMIFYYNIKSVSNCGLANPLSLHLAPQGGANTFCGRSIALIHSSTARRCEYRADKSANYRPDKSGNYKLPNSIWWSRRDLNPRPSRCERDALPAELRPRFMLAKLRFAATIA